MNNMAGYPGGRYPNNPGGYPAGGSSMRMPQGGYPGASPMGGAYPGATPNPGGAPGYPAGMQGAGYPGVNAYQARPGGRLNLAAQAQPGGISAGQFGGYPSGAGMYAQPPSHIDPTVQQWFSAVDTDRSGQITARELKSALRNGDWSNSHFSEEACRLMIELHDKNKSGSIEINEFQQLFNTINEWRGIFQRFDTDRSGTIEQSELIQAFAQMGYQFSPMFVQGLLSKYDMRTKRLSLDNFIVITMRIRSLTDGFRNRDQMKNGQATMQYEDFLGLAMGVTQ